MTSHFADWDENTLDLVIERFTLGQDPHDEARLDQLAEGVDLQDFEDALAAIHLGALGPLETPPAEFLLGLEREGREYVAESVPAPVPQPGRVPRSPSRVLAYGGWLVAAGLLLTVVLLQQAGDIDAFALREALIADAADLVRVDWTATDDPAALGAGGDVVWSSSQQAGYMRFEDLAPNDPKLNQYQLWIFDPTRAEWEDKPVDGGVFDVPPGGAVVVPIDAKLAVRETALFAVTLEVPGGVVVSKRERLVLTAAL